MWCEACVGQVDHPTDSEQCELALADKRLVIPWDGRSPRSLTRVWKTLSLGAPPTGGLHVAPKTTGLIRSPDQFLLLLSGSDTHTRGG